MAARMLGVLATTAGFAAHIVLAGEAAGPHGALVSELGFDPRDLSFHFLEGWSRLHIPKAYICYRICATAFPLKPSRYVLTSSGWLGCAPSNPCARPAPAPPPSCGWCSCWPLCACAPTWRE